MKRILYVLLALVFVFSFTACGNDQPSTADGDIMAAEQIEVDEVEAEDSDSGSSGSSSSFSCDGDPIVAFGGYTCYDRFSGEQVGGVYIHVHDSNSSKVVFNYITNNGSYYDLTANLDSSQRATVYINDTLSLEMTFDQSTIYVDEIQGMGAMAYDFKH